MKKVYLSLLLAFAITASFAQIPAGYYDSATGTGETLKTQLFNIISSHNNIGYNGLWELYKFSDIDHYYENDGTILDMYSENPTGADSYNYTPGSDQCGNYSGEGSCYNREHSFPKSWFNDASPMYSDAFHIYPTDGKVNGERSNYPYGEVSNPSWTSLNGSKLGPCSYPGYSGTVFEPIDEFKGDLARTYFYMATCYEDKISGWSSAVLNGTSYPCYTSWFIDMLLEWNAQDPVSQREIDRNNDIYYGDTNGDYAQGNRNPYIDHPEWVECVWNNNCAGSVNPPSNLTATGVAISEIDLTWSLNASNNDILLAYNTTNTFGTPSGTYTAGNTISGGGTVLSVGNSTSFSHTGLSAQTYYYKIWSYDGTDYSSGITAFATPLISEPSNHVTNFTISNLGSTTIDLVWTDATGTTAPAAYLIKANLSGSAINPPVDGQPEADGTFSKNIAFGTESVTFNNLNPNTSYDFEIFPYTNSGASIDYKTDGTVPSATGTTADTPIDIINEDFTTCPATDWTIYSVAGNKDWECGTNSDMSVNAYGGDVASDDWFISPAINFNNYTNETLTFDTYTKYSDTGITDPEVRLKYSTDYTGSGDPGLAAWTELTYNFPTENSTTWTGSGNINLSAINGTSVYIAFRYISTGTTATNAALWELDNIILTGNQSSGGGNTLPEFTSTPVTSATSGQTYTYNITATDVDGDNLTFTAPTKPAWLTLTDNGNGTAILSGTPQNSDAGNNLVSLSVFDGTGNVNQNFTIVVTAVNTAPQYTSTPVTSATAGQTYTYNITATDSDGDNLTFTAPTKPTWLTLTDNGNGTATLTGTPQNSDAGDNSVSLSVSDGTENVNQDFTINVAASSSINNQNSKSIHIFPNPAKHGVTIQSSDKIVSLKLKNILGKTVYKIQELNTSELHLNLNNLSKGIYFVEIATIGNNTILKKLIIE